MEQAPPDYPSAFLQREGCQDSEVASVLDWLLDFGPVVAVTPTVASAKQTPLPARLERNGVRVVPRPRLSYADAAGVPVLALWPTLETLHEIESRKPASIGCAPWGLREIEVWWRSRRPVDLAKGEKVDGPSLHPVVERGLLTLSMASNPSNGLASYNRDMAIDVFRQLRAAGYGWDGIAVGAFIASRGWSLRHAGELAVFSQEIADGKVKRGGGEFAKGLVARWEQEVNEGE